MRFTESGNLNERINDSDFILRILNGSKINIDDQILPIRLQSTPEIEKFRTRQSERFIFLKKIKQAFEILGVRIPIEITKFSEKDFITIGAIVERLVDNNSGFSIFTEDGFKIIKISEYTIALFFYKGKILNVYSRDFCSSTQVYDTLDEHRIIEVSPYCFLASDAIAHHSNFDRAIVMESIKAFPFSEESDMAYNKLLLESIKAFDMIPDSEGIEKFTNELADYLLENNDSAINRLNKLQIKKRLQVLEQSDADWLISEKGKQDNPEILCGIAVLLSDRILFNDQFSKLTDDAKNAFQTYPIMKLL
jgi:hypothetical protein